MQEMQHQPILGGRKALVVGIANDSSIATGCARAFRELGADLAVTYLNEKARPHVEPIARELGAALVLPLDVAVAGELESVFDAIVFTAGIGENSRSLRERVCRDAEWLGVELDVEANQRGICCVSTAASRVSAWVIPTNEELMIARHTEKLLAR